MNRSKDRPHPATFPVELAVNCIRIHGGDGRVVKDPFLGIGHSALAARQLGAAKFIGFEIDEEYAEIARDALEKGAAKLPKRSTRATSKNGDGELFRLE